MFFSIVVPVYQVEPYINRCVDSVLSQQFDDYELILVDDGSPDGAPHRCDAYASENERVKVVHCRNAGLSSARNLGIKLACGQYLLFLDSDDLWNNNIALGELYATIKNNAYPDLVCYGTDLYDENDTVIKTRVPGTVTGSIYDRLQTLVYRNEYISTAYVKAVKADFVKVNDLLFKYGIFSEDIEWSGRILERLKSVAVYPKAFCKRICRKEGSLTANIGRKNIGDILDSIEAAMLRIGFLDCEDTMRDIYYEYWAYQYAMVLSLMHYIKTEPDFDAYIARLKKLQWLLHFDHDKKVFAVEIMVKVIGIKGTVAVLGLR